MNGADLARAATILYGQHFQVPLAKLLGVTPRAVRWYLSGGRQIPREAWVTLSEALEERSPQARREAERLQAALGLPTYRVTWNFDSGKVWSKGGYSHARAVELKEYPLRYGLPVRSATMEPEEQRPFCEDMLG